MTEEVQANRGRRFTPEEREVMAGQITEAYASGRSIRDIAAEHGRSFGWVHGVLEEAGAEMRPRGGAWRRQKSQAEEVQQ